MAGSAWTLVAVALVLGAGALVIPESAALHHAGGSPGGAESDSLMLAATKDYGYQPATFQQVPTNATITVTFTDDDVLQHSFAISSREGFVIPTGYTDAQLAQFFVTSPALYYSIVNAVGDQAVGTFHSPSVPGWYEFVCNVTGHFENGMYGFLAFGEVLPSNLTTPTRVGIGGVNLSPLDEVGVGTIVVATALAVVFWQRRRSAQRGSRKSDRTT